MSGELKVNRMAYVGHEALSYLLSRLVLMPATDLGDPVFDSKLIYVPLV